MQERGADGLKLAELVASRAAFWDEALTRALVEALPRGPRPIVEVGCGTGAAVRALAGSFRGPGLIGLDIDRPRLDRAAKDGPAGRWIQADALALPLADGAAGAVLTAMTLQHLPRPGLALAEARRVLCPGGRVVALEPHNLGQRFCFDGPLPEVDRTLAALAGACREARAPADLALGPRLGRLLEDAGLERVTLRALVVQRTIREPAKDAYARFAWTVATLGESAGLGPDSAVRRACATALEAAFVGHSGAVGWSANLVPVFLATGERP